MLRILSESDLAVVPKQETEKPKVSQLRPSVARLTMYSLGHGTDAARHPNMLSHVDLERSPACDLSDNGKVKSTSLKFYNHHNSPEEDQLLRVRMALSQLRIGLTG